MGRSKKPLLEKVEITAVGSEGKALGRVNDMVVFVPMMVPGDIVDIQVTRKRKKFMEGFVTRVHKYSDMRQEARCSHFGECGGCKWQHLPYSRQLEFKQQQVEDNFRRIGGFDFPAVEPIMKSANEFYYRNKLEFTFSNKRWLTKSEVESGRTFDQMNALGFHVPGRFDKVLDIEHCYLQNPLSNEIRNEVRDFAIAREIPFFDLVNHQGFLRNLIIRTASTGELMVIFSFYADDPDLRELIMSYIAERFPQITSLMYTVNDKPNDSISDREIISYKGRDHIIEEMEGLRFRVGPKSFYQTNTLQAYELYKVARSFAALTGHEVVYDLYTGTGTIANFVAQAAEKVIGIEYVSEAIDDAVVNSGLNDLKNTIFFSGDIKDILNGDFIRTNGAPHVIITDPPRAGMHEKVTMAIAEASPDRIVYVSCNPATQARDIALLSDRYRVTRVQPVDMFPQTHHVECVALLERR
ncbi:MAG: 23S rRNA (uracil(1939)-C(5))-methyltransferase RlmD [Bacteroidales bacterium]